MNNAVNLRCENFALSIKPKILDLETEDYITEVDPRIPETRILELYQNPNSDQTTTQLLEAQSKSFEVTGDMYTIALALTEDSEPFSIEYVNPVCVQPTPDGRGGVANYIVTKGASAENFYPVETDKKEIRFFTKDMTQELNHMKTFNPDASTGGQSALTGMSPYSALFYEAEQLESAMVHNWSTLAQGASPSAAVTIDKDANLTDDQVQRLKKQVQDKVIGAENAGNIMFLEGGKDIKMLSMSNKDMDFHILVKENKEQVYRSRNIPPSLVDAQPKFSNLQEAKNQLFDMAVFPFATRYFEEQNKFLMPRYDKKKRGRYILSYDPNDVPAMEYAQIEKAKLKSETGVNTVDEIRTVLGDDSIGGKEGEAFVLNGNVSHSTGVMDQPEPTDEKGMSREYFTNLMKKQMTDGKRMYSDTEIVVKANEMSFLT